jgi:predicted nucleotidyltransferase
LQNVIDLTEDPSIGYLLAGRYRGDFNDFSDIDLHVVVVDGFKKEFIKNKKNRAAKWGNVLFYEGVSATPVIVSHYDSFIKVDSWYHTLDEIEPSIWLKGIKPLYDPSGILNPIVEEVLMMSLELEADDILYWKTKVLAFFHGTYRAVMCNELYYALSNLIEFDGLFPMDGIWK